GDDGSPRRPAPQNSGCAPGICRFAPALPPGNSETFGQSGPRVLFLASGSYANAMPFRAAGPERMRYSQTCGEANKMTDDLKKIHPYLPKLLEQFQAGKVD